MCVVKVSYWNFNIESKHMLVRVHSLTVTHISTPSQTVRLQFICRSMYGLRGQSRLIRPVALLRPDYIIMSDICEMSRLFEKHVKDNCVTFRWHSVLHATFERDPEVIVRPTQPRTTHHSPCTTHHPPLTTHHAPLTTLRSPLTTHHAPLTTHHAPRTSPIWNEGHLEVSSDTTRM